MRPGGSRGGAKALRLLTGLFSPEMSLGGRLARCAENQVRCWVD